MKVIEKIIYVFFIFLIFFSLNLSAQTNSISPQNLITTDNIPTELNFKANIPLPSGEGFGGATSDGRYLYVPLFNGDLQIFDMQNFDNPQFITKLTMPAGVTASHTFYYNKHLYFSSSDKKLHIYDCSDPINLVHRSSTNIDGTISSMSFDNNAAFALIPYVTGLNGKSRFIIFDISNPLNPTEKSRIDIDGRGGNGVNLHYSKNRNIVYLRGMLNATSGAITTINVANLILPAILNVSNFTMKNNDQIVGYDNYFIISQTNASKTNLNVYNTSNATNPQLIKSYELPGTKEMMGMKDIDGLLLVYAGPFGSNSISSYSYNSVSNEFTAGPEIADNVGWGTYEFVIFKEPISNQTVLKKEINSSNYYAVFGYGSPPQRTIEIKYGSNKYNLIANVSPQDAQLAGCTVNGGGEYDKNSTATVSATFPSSWTFEYWTGDLQGTDNPSFLFMNSDKTVTGHFRKKDEPILEVSGVKGEQYYCPTEIYPDTFYAVGEINFVANNVSDWALQSFQLESFGTGDDKLDIKVVKVEGPVTLLREYSKDNGILTADFNPAINIPKGSSVKFYISYKFAFEGDKYAYDEVKTFSWVSRSVTAAPSLFPPGTIEGEAKMDSFVVARIRTIRNGNSTGFYSKISDAVVSSKTIDNDLVLVCDGSYEDIIKVDKTLFINSVNGSQKTSVKSKVNDNIFEVRKGGTQISGFKVLGSQNQNAAVINNSMKKSLSKNVNIAQLKFPVTGWGIYSNSLITLSDVHVNYNSSGGVFVENGILNISQVYIEQNEGPGIMCSFKEGELISEPFENIVFGNFRIRNNKGPGILIHGKNLSINGTDNIINGNTNSGIEVLSGNLIIGGTNNQIENNGGWGIKGDNRRSLQILQSSLSKINDNIEGGISSGPKILLPKGLIVEDNSGFGIYCSIVENELLQEPYENLVLEDIKVRNNGSDGLFLFGANLIVKGNESEFIKNIGNGISSYAGNIKIEGNNCQINNNSGLGIRASENGSLFIEQGAVTIINNNKKGGIYSGSKINLPVGLIVEDNDGHGIECNIMEGLLISKPYDLISFESIKVRRNKGDGIRNYAGDLQLRGAANEIINNEGDGIKSLLGSVYFEGTDNQLNNNKGWGVFSMGGSVSITEGALTSIHKNNKGGIYAGGWITLPKGMKIEDNGGPGLFCGGEDVLSENTAPLPIVLENIKIRNNIGHGVHLMGASINLFGENNEIIDNGGTGLYSVYGDINISGANNQIHSNVGWGIQTLKGKVDIKTGAMQSIYQNDKGGIYSWNSVSLPHGFRIENNGGPGLVIVNGDTYLTNIKIKNNKNDGIYCGASLFLFGNNNEISYNNGWGIKSEGFNDSRLVFHEGGKIIENIKGGIRIISNSFWADNLLIANNLGDGILASSSTNFKLYNSRLNFNKGYGLVSIYSPIQVNNVTHMGNVKGGTLFISNKEADNSYSKTGDSYLVELPVRRNILTDLHNSNELALITKSTFENNIGDAIKFEGGINPIIRHNNFLSNGGNAVKNLNSNTTIDAKYNYWGNSNGPVNGILSGNINSENWMPEKVGFVSSVEKETLFIKMGATDSTKIFYQNHKVLNDRVNIEIIDEDGLVISEKKSTCEMKDSSGTSLKIKISVPQNISPNKISRIIVKSIPNSNTNIQNNDTIKVTSYLPQLSEIMLKPDTHIVEAGDSVQYIFSGYDQFKNNFLFSPIWNSDIGKINSSGLLKATSEGEGKVTITDPISGLNKIASIKIIGGKLILTKIVISPDSVVLKPNDMQQFTYKGLNQFGFNHPAQIIWFTDGGKIDEDGLFVTPNISGNFIVTAHDTSSGIKGYANIIIEKIVSVENELSLPSNYSLFQNYPNPFNPITTIKYSIPTVSSSLSRTEQLVTLKVYDILGKEVALLVNEKQSAGNYEVRFDGSKLASGVYLYKLQCGEFTSIKKLLLMK